MTGAERDVDSLRRRWRRYRQHQLMTEERCEDFATGGLARHIDELAMRLLILPADPKVETVPFDPETMSWLKEDRASPYGGAGPQWGPYDRATTQALVRYDHRGDATKWSRYLAIHRHGGLDVGIGRLSFPIREVTVFPLRQIVGLAWSATALQLEAISTWDIRGPFEISFGLRCTFGATLGDFAEGWRGPDDMRWNYSTCLDEKVLMISEMQAISPKEFSLELGNRVEQAFGTMHRRHIANRGEYNNTFDPRFRS